MKWSLKLGRILGIDVYLHLTFLLLLGFVAVSAWLGNQAVSAAFGGLLFFLCLFACVLLHEFGHALAARAYGITTRDIVLLPIGGVARLERMPEKPLQELWVALAGPLVNVMIAGGLSFALLLRGWRPSLNWMQPGLAEKLLIVNVFLIVFNLLPAFPMDGGRVLRAMLALRLEYVVATRIAAAIGKAMAVLFGFVSLFSNPMLMLIAIFVWVGATHESTEVDLKAHFDGARVRDAMLTHFHTLSSGQTLSEAARNLLAASQRDFPVVENGRFAGMLLRQDLLDGLRSTGGTTPVEQVMRREVRAVNADDLLEAALAGAGGERGATMAVLREGQLAGLLTAENVTAFYLIRAALAQSAKDGTGAQNGGGLPPVIAEFGPHPERSPRRS